MKYMGPVTDSSTSWYWLRNGCDWIHRHTPGRITSIFHHLFPLPLYVAFTFLVCHPPPGTHPKAITMVMSLPQGHHQNDGLRVCPGGRYYTKKLNATLSQQRCLQFLKKINALSMKLGLQCEKVERWCPYPRDITMVMALGCVPGGGWDTKKLNATLSQERCLQFLKKRNDLSMKVWLHYEKVEPWSFNFYRTDESNKLWPNMENLNPEGSICTTEKVTIFHECVV